MECVYCSDEAKGIDVDGDPTCGNAETCTTVTDPLPRVVESNDDDAEEN